MAIIQNILPGFNVDYQVIFNEVSAQQRQAWQTEYNRILVAVPAPLLPWRRHNTHHLCKWHIRFNRCLDEFILLLGVSEKDVELYSEIWCDYQETKTTRNLLVDIIRSRGWVYVSPNIWVDPVEAKELDDCNGWEERYPANTVWRMVNGK
jgi:hypothetical protein